MVGFGLVFQFFAELFFQVIHHGVKEHVIVVRIGTVAGAAVRVRAASQDEVGYERENIHGRRRGPGEGQKEGSPSCPPPREARYSVVEGIVCACVRGEGVRRCGRVARALARTSNLNGLDLGIIVAAPTGRAKEGQPAMPAA